MFHTNINNGTLSTVNESTDDYSSDVDSSADSEESAGELRDTNLIQFKWAETKYIRNSPKIKDKLPVEHLLDGAVPQEPPPIDVED